MNNNQGWISLYRKLLKWEWYNDPVVKCVFLHILLSANHEDAVWQGIEIKRGELITSVDSIFNGLNRNPLTGKLTRKRDQISVQAIRTAIGKLISTSEITIETTNRFTRIIVCKYNEYQTSERVNQQTEQQANQTDSNKLSTTNNNDNNENNLNINSEAIEMEKTDLANALQNLDVSKKKPGASYSWQDQASRFAKSLGIELNKTNSPSWFKLFKMANTNKDLYRRIQSSYSFLIDYKPFLEKESDHRIKYFYAKVNGKF